MTSSPTPAPTPEPEHLLQRLVRWARRVSPSWSEPAYRAAIKTIDNYYRDRCPTLAAGLAFFGLLSVAPAAMFTVAIGSAFLTQVDVQQELIALAREYGGDDPAQALQRLIGDATVPSLDTWSAVFALAILAFGAARVFQHLHASLNLVFDVEPKPVHAGWAAARLVYKRAVSFGLLALMAAGLLGTVVVNATIGAFLHRFSEIVHLNAVLYLVKPVSTGISLTLGTVLIAIFYKVLPDIVLPWRPALMASSVVSILFAFARWGLETYVALVGIDSSFGAAGSLVVLMLWMYVSFALLLAGAQLCVTLVEAQGGRIEPERWAHRVEAHGRALPPSP